MSDADGLRARIMAAGETAQTAAEVCAWRARAEWFNAHDGAECPRIPAPAEMAKWLPECPQSERIEAAELVGALYDRPAVWSPVTFDDELQPVAMLIQPKILPGMIALQDRDGTHHGAIMASLTTVHATWLALPDPRPRHPLAPLVDAWLSNASEPARVTTHPAPIMARSVAQVRPDAEGVYLARFGTAAHRAPGGQLLLGFASDAEHGPSLPANVWTMGLADAEKRGAVVPLALRIWVAAILLTPIHARHGNYPASLMAPNGDPLTLRRFLSWLYPNRTPRPNEYWSKLLKARDVVNSVELVYERDGNLWGRQVVIMDNPLTRPGLDDPWPVATHFPPGDGTGPAIDFARLQYWSTRDGSCYRALINLHYRWHIEGKRLMPARRGKHWLHRRDPKLYDRLTDAEAEGLCYPPRHGKQAPGRAHYRCSRGA